MSCAVSIQLVSPARGESLRRLLLLLYSRCFHSIGFPCERGDIFVLDDATPNESFHSIGFPCERGAVKVMAYTKKAGSFPFNWFPLREGRLTAADHFVFSSMNHLVSIQLVSPARGEALEFDAVDFQRYYVSIQLVSPARGEATLLATKV